MNINGFYFKKDYNYERAQREEYYEDFWTEDEYEEDEEDEE